MCACKAHLEYKLNRQIGATEINEEVIDVEVV